MCATIFAWRHPDHPSELPTELTRVPESGGNSNFLHAAGLVTKQLLRPPDPASAYEGDEGESRVMAQQASGEAHRSRERVRDFGEREVGVVMPRVDDVECTGDIGARMSGTAERIT